MRGKRFVRHHANADPLGNHPHQCSLIVYLQLGGDGEPQEPRLFKHKSLHGTGIIERDPSGFGFQYVFEESFLYRSHWMVLRCHDDEVVFPIGSEGDIRVGADVCRHTDVGTASGNRLNHIRRRPLFKNDAGGRMIRHKVRNVFGQKINGGAVIGNDADELPVNRRLQ